MNEPQLPIGIQTFEDIRKNRLRYVDKTNFLVQLLTSGFKSVFLSRPHRFGKSLFLSTLRAYFEGRKELFDGLYIAQCEEKIAKEQKREPWQSCPVLYFDFNAKDYADTNTLKRRIEEQLKEFERLYGVMHETEDPEDRLIYLIKTLAREQGKQVVILIDEYDKPLLETITNIELNEANRSLLKAFYEVLKNCDRYIRFAFLTGITKFSKTTLFSGVNNLKDITLLDTYAPICGFTEDELTQYFSHEIDELALVQKCSVAKVRKTLKKKYDGYSFSRCGAKVYNPFSLLNVLADKSYDYYWFETATPSYLVNYLKQTQVFIPDLDNDVKIGSQVVLDFRYNDKDSIIPLLFQSGYLTIKKTIAKATIFQLGYPNEEVRFGFLHELIPLYSSLTRANTDIEILNLYEELDRGDLLTALQHVQTILAGIQYGNIPNDETGRPLREQYYQSVLYVVFRLLGTYASSEVVCATGRIDMIISTRKHIYLFEFKVNTQATADQTIEQIKTRGYLRSIRSGKRPIHLVGVSFNEKTRNIGEWKELLISPEH